MFRHHKGYFTVWVRRAALLGLGAALAGCTDTDTSDLKRYVVEVKSSPRGAVEPLPEIKTVEPFIFNPEDLHDPFAAPDNKPPPDEGPVESGLRPDTARPREELESYELDSLRMVGTVHQGGILWGLIRANDGTIHRVRTGNFMGKNYGKIVNIKETLIELVEIVSDNPGTWRERKAAIDLVEAAGGNR
jgi:type IV pilus assembly protein PilP